MCHVLMINFLMIIEKAVCKLGSISLQDKKIKSNNYQFLCVGHLIYILVLFLLRHLNWIKRYSTMKIEHFFLFEYIFCGCLVNCCMLGNTAYHKCLKGDFRLLSWLYKKKVLTNRADSDQTSSEDKILCQKTADRDLHCFQERIYLGTAGQG